MIHIKRFIDRISQVEGRNGKDVVMPITDARGLRDELSKLLAHNYELMSTKVPVQSESIIQVEITGSKF